MEERHSNISLGDDLLVGAEAIAQELGFSRRRVYHLADQDNGFPIHRVKGLGLTARKSALRAWFAGLDDYDGREARASQ